MATLESQIADLLDTYLSTFNAGDFTTASRYYDQPSVAVGASGLAIFQTREDFAGLLASTVTRLKRVGFDRSEWVGEKQITVLEDDGFKGLVTASCVCKRLKEDGSSCEEFTVVYTLRRVEGQWLIVAILQHPVETK